MTRFDDKEIVALSGAHAMGRCHTGKSSLNYHMIDPEKHHPDRSGFDGPWTHSPVTFSNVCIPPYVANISLI